MLDLLFSFLDFSFFSLLAVYAIRRAKNKVLALFVYVLFVYKYQMKEDLLL